MSKRFLDRKDTSEFIKECSDFQNRTHTIPLIRIILMFLIVILIVMTILGQLITNMYFPQLGTEQPDENDVFFTLSVVVLLTTLIVTFCIWLIYRIRQNMNNIEFQNSIFAGCMRIKCDFCLIVHKNKKGIYCDYNFGEIFSDFEKDDDPFHHLLDTKSLSKEDEEKLDNAINVGEEAEFVFSIKNNNNESKEIHISINPIDKPHGFFIIKGYEIGMK